MVPNGVMLNLQMEKNVIIIKLHITVDVTIELTCLKGSKVLGG